MAQRARAGGRRGAGPATGISTAATTILVDRLERAGHVERVRNTDDRRRVTLTATSEARAAALRAWLPAIREIDEISRALSEPERAFARDLLSRLTTAMANSAQQ